MKQVTVRAYGARLLGGKESEALATSVFLAQNKLWNNFVEIENKNRAAYQVALASSDDELGSLVKHTEVLSESIEDLIKLRGTDRAKARSKKIVGHDVYSQSIKALSEQRKAVYAQVKTCKARAKIAAQPLIEALELERRAQVKAVVAASGMWWGHVETVAAKYDVSRFKAMKTGAQLRFHRFDGEGSMGIRFSTDGGSLDKIRAGKTDLLAIARPDATILGMAKEVKADGGRRVLLTFRAGSKADDGSIPKLTFLATIHGGRDLPEGIPLKTVTLRRDMHVGKPCWKIVFTFVAEIDALPPVDLPGEVCGIDFGWRKVIDGDGNKGIRVAAISWGADKNIQYVVLDHVWLERMNRASRLQGQLDDSANQFWARLSPLITNDALDSAGVSPEEWFYRICGKARRAKRVYPSLLIDLCKAYEAVAERMPDASVTITGWLSGAIKLATETHHTRRKAVDHRKHLYRNAASSIVKRAGMIGVEDVSFKDIALLSDGLGNDNELHETARANRVLAAPSELRLAIVQAAKREQRELVDVPAAGTTATCSSCGHDHGKITELMFVCDGCGKVWDQDENAGHNCRNFTLDLQKVD